MEDLFMEHMVKREPDARSNIIKLCTMVITALLMYLSLVLSQRYAHLLYVLPLMLVGFAWLGYRVFMTQNCEFEYILTNGELDVDRILAKRARRRLINIKTGNYELVAPYDEGHRNEYERGQFKATIDTRTSKNAQGVWFIICTVKDKGRVRLLFEPTKEMIDHIRHFVPFKVANVPDAFEEEG